MKTTPVSVVIPTYNGLHLLKNHIPAVLECLRDGDELVVADDSNRDENAEWLKTTFKLSDRREKEEYWWWSGEYTYHRKTISIKVILNKKNLRFAANANRGVSVSSHSLIFLINNDVSPHAEVIKRVMPYFDDETVFAVGCHEIEKNLGGISGGKNKLWFERGLFVHSRPDDFESGETSWASGGSAFFDRSKWDELGGFDPAYYPAYWEDIDLSFRAKQRGWKVLFEKMAVVSHNHETTNTTVFGQRQMEQMSFKNALVFVWKHGSFWQKVQHLLWLPYHLTITNWKTKGTFNQGWISFCLYQLHQ